MIRGLLPRLDLPQLDPGVEGRGAEHLHKQLRGHEMAAGGGGEVAAPGQGAQGAQIDLLVALLRPSYGFAGFGEGRGIEDDQIVVALFERGQELKDVAAPPMAALSAKEPVCVKQSSTRRPFASLATARRLYF